VTEALFDARSSRKSAQRAEADNICFPSSLFLMQELARYSEWNRRDLERAETIARIRESGNRAFRSINVPPPPPLDGAATSDKQIIVFFFSTDGRDERHVRQRNSSMPVSFFFSSLTPARIGAPPHYCSGQGRRRTWASIGVRCGWSCESLLRGTRLFYLSLSMSADWRGHSWRSRRSRCTIWLKARSSRRHTIEEARLGTAPGWQSRLR